MGWCEALPIFSWFRWQTLSLRTLDGVTSVTEARLLGVILSCNLKWNQHIDAAVQRASKLLFCIYRLKQCGVSSKLLWTIYQSLIRSIICFAYLMLCNLSKYLFARLVRLEHRVARIIGCEPPVHLIDFCEQQCKRLNCKIVRDDEHPLRELCLQNPIHSYSLRTAAQVLQPPRTKTSRFKNSFIRFIGRNSWFVCLLRVSVR